MHARMCLFPGFPGGEGDPFFAASLPSHDKITATLNWPMASSTLKRDVLCSVHYMPRAVFQSPPGQWASWSLSYKHKCLKCQHLSLDLRSELSLESGIPAPVYVLPTRQPSASLEGDQAHTAEEAYTQVFCSIKKKKALHNNIWKLG